jgi:tetratricopeptide (TPR) repeat protein
MTARDPTIHALGDGEYRFGTSGIGPVDERWSALTRARERFESIGDLRCASWCALDMGIIKGTEFGDLHDAERLFEQARDGLTECEVWRGVGLAVAKLANLAVVRGDVAKARRQLMSFDEHIGLIDATASASIARAWADVHQAEGNWGASITELRKAVSCYERAGLGHELLGARVQLGQALVACRRLDEAQIQADLAEEASPAARPIDRSGLPRLRASIAIARGKAIKGIGQLESALADDNVAPFDELYIRLQFGESALIAGNLASAEVELRRSVELARTLSVPITLARALEGLARCLTQSGDIRAAFAAANESVEVDESANEHNVIRRIERCSAAVSLARQVADIDAVRHLLPKLSAALERVDDPNQVAQAIRVAVEALRATGNELAARRLQARLSRI